MTLRWDDPRKRREFWRGAAFSMLVTVGPLALLTALIPGQGPDGQIGYRIAIPSFFGIMLAALLACYRANGRKLEGDVVRTDEAGIEFWIAGERQWAVPWSEIQGYEEFWKSPNGEPRKGIGGTGLRLLTDAPGDLWFLVSGNNYGDIPDRKALMAELDAHLPAGARRYRVKSLPLEAYRSTQAKA